MFKDKSEHSYADLFEGMLIGGSLVAMTTFLFGTKKGKDFQKKLLSKYKILKHKAEDIQEKLHQTTASPKKAKQMVKTIKTKVKRAIPKIKTKASRAR